MKDLIKKIRNRKKSKSISVGTKSINTGWSKEVLNQIRSMSGINGIGIYESNSDEYSVYNDHYLKMVNDILPKPGKLPYNYFDF